jgi:hypothetical protein
MNSLFDLAINQDLLCVMVGNATTFHHDNYLLHVLSCGVLNSLRFLLCNHVSLHELSLLQSLVSFYLIFSYLW